MGEEGGDGKERQTEHENKKKDPKTKEEERQGKEKT